MNNYLLVINAGSSSIKFAIYKKSALSGQLKVEAAGQIESIGIQPKFTVQDSLGVTLVEKSFTVDENPDHTSAINVICLWVEEYFKKGSLLAIGHRVVHGGQHYSAPVVIDSKVLNELESLVPLAPLHQPHNLAAIRVLLEAAPMVPQVACFDTAFHCTQPEVAKRLAIPRRFADEGVRRYGFHGLSYEYIASILPSLEPKLADARVIVAHLGSGASLCALQNGRSVATTMSFSPLDGLVMGTRCGNLDPSVLIYLMDRHNMDARALETLLYHQSGLLGISGISSDMRILLVSKEAPAQEAIESFVYRIGREIGSLAAALGGLDALVFTGGIGEHSPVIRAEICRQAAWLGLEVDHAANEAPATRISTIDSKLSAWVVPTDENLMIARHTQQLVQVY